MRLLAFALLPLFAMQAEGPRVVRGIRCSVENETTVVTVELSGEFEYTTERLREPERIYFDIPASRPNIDSRATYSQDIESVLVRRVRAAEAAPGVTRVVLDLRKPVEVAVTKLSAPARLRIAVRPVSQNAEDRQPASASASDQTVVVAQAQPDRRPPSRPVAAPAQTELTILISPGAAAPGSTAALVLGSISSGNGDLVALQWRLSYPSPQVGIDPGAIAPGEATKSAGKRVTCAGQPQGPGTYAYDCIVAGGSKLLPSGPVATVPIQVRTTARTGTVAVKITGVVGVHGDGQSVHLPDASASLEIR